MCTYALIPLIEFWNWKQTERLHFLGYLSNTRWHIFIYIQPFPLSLSVSNKLCTYCRIMYWEQLCLITVFLFFQRCFVSSALKANICVCKPVFCVGFVLEYIYIQPFTLVWTRRSRWPTVAYVFTLTPVCMAKFWFLKLHTLCSHCFMFLESLSVKHMKGADFVSLNIFSSYPLSPQPASPSSHKATVIWLKEIVVVDFIEKILEL